MKSKTANVKSVPHSQRIGLTSSMKSKTANVKSVPHSHNANIIRKAYGDFAKGNMPAALEAFDASITWHVPGHSPLSGDYKGRDKVVGFFKHTLELCGGAFAIEVQHVLAEEDVVV